MQSIFGQNDNYFFKIMYCFFTRAIFLILGHYLDLYLKGWGERNDEEDDKEDDEGRW